MDSASTLGCELDRDKCRVIHVPSQIIDHTTVSLGVLFQQGCDNRHTLEYMRSHF